MAVKENTTEEQILKKVRDLETHLCNLIANVQFSHEFKRMQQCIESFNDLTSQPFKVDVSSFKEVSQELKTTMGEFVEQTRSFEVSALVKEIKDLTQEIKNINDRIDNMEKFGVKKNIHLDVGLFNGDLVIPRYSGVKVEDLRLSYKCDKIIRMHNSIDSTTLISEFLKIPPYEISSLSGMGRKTFEELCSTLKKYDVVIGGNL